MVFYIQKEMANMSKTQVGIADMQCWVFRKAQKKWNMSPSECADMFKKYDLLGFRQSPHSKINTGRSSSSLTACVL